MLRRATIATFLVALAMAAFASGTAVAEPREYVGHMKGSDTVAQGQLNLKLDKSGQALDAKLEVAGVIDASAVHVHLRTPSGDQGLVLRLYPFPNFLDGEGKLISGRFSGSAFYRAILPGQLRGVLTGKSFGDLAAEIEAGNAYVDLHPGVNCVELDSGAFACQPGPVLISGPIR